MTAPQDRLFTAVQGIARLHEDPALVTDEPRMLAAAGALMADLVAHDDWLPAAMAEPHPQFYRQYLLYGDPLERFSMVSFVWGPGQATPIHNHTVWGIIAMLRGAEYAQRYVLGGGAPRAEGGELRLEPGQIECVSPTIGDVHRVRNAFDDRVSISIHLYGGNIGRIRRAVFDENTGVEKPFVSGYSNALVPNLWGAS